MRTIMAVVFYSLSAVVIVQLISTFTLAKDYDRSNYPYSRSDFGCKSPLDKVIDVNNGETILCKFADLDHRVPLKLAHDSKISDNKIKELARDRNNVVWTRSEINRAKGPLSSEGFQKVLKDKNSLDGRRFNRHLRGSIATKQKYGIPLDDLEKQYAFKLKNLSPSYRITKRVPTEIKFTEAIEKVRKKYGRKIAEKVALRAGGVFVPGAGWAVSGGLVLYDFSKWYFTGKCDLCDATKYFQDLMKVEEKYEIQEVANPTPIIIPEDEYYVLPSSFPELQAELDHVRSLIKKDPWGQYPDTKAHKEYLRQLNEELIKRKFS